MPESENRHTAQRCGTEDPKPLTLNVERQGTSVPAVFWLPKEQPKGILMACHGGSGHKQAPSILAIARAAGAQGLVVLSVDGPVHGERREDGDLSPQTARTAFRDAWRAGIGKTDMAADFTAALDGLLRHLNLPDLPIGYIGVSMGTAYGLPLLAQEKRIKAAAIGLWSTTYAASEHLAGYAERVDCSIWFTQQWNDEFFDRQGTAALFDALGSSDKRLVAYPGPHRELEGERLDAAIAFLTARLLRGAERCAQ
jgi:dienelactone hydrolase